MSIKKEDIVKYPHVYSNTSTSWAEDVELFENNKIDLVELSKCAYKIRDRTPDADIFFNLVDKYKTIKKNDPYWQFFVSQGSLYTVSARSQTVSSILFT